MKKAYLYNNYVVIEDGINVYLFNIYNSFTVVNSNDYTIQSSVGNRAVILIADAPNWYDETGTIPFDADSLLLFLETYTGQFQKAENGIPEGGTTGQILAKIDETDYNAEWIDNYANWTSQLKHQVKAGVPLIKGQAVYVSSADGTNMVVSKASNVSESTSSKTMGLIAQNLATNGKGYLITEGLLAGLNTSTANAGDPVWLGTNGNLIFGLTNKPHAPAHLVFIGIVTRSNSNNGEIFVKVQNGFELEELHNVAITSPANKNTIFFNSSNSLWENRLIAIDDVSSLQSALNSKENTSNKGIANGYASLGGDGKVPSTQLPSYVDDVIEVANYASLPSIGETGVIYITLDNNKVYRWTGSTYVQISQPNAIWGSITGTLSNQTDLQSALNAKQDAATAINTSNIGSQSVAYATNAGNADTLDGYHASAFQMVLTNPVTGTGILNYVAKFGSSSTIENSQIYDNGFQVGVGLTNPSSRFHVNGLSILTNPSGDNYNENLRLPQAAGGYASIALGGPVATVGTSVQQWTIVKDPTNNFMIRHFGTDHLFINSDGNVGLGTTNPNDKFHVVGGIYSTSIGNPINGSIGAIQVGYDGTNGRVRTWNSSPLIYTSYNYQSWETTGSERMRITSGGNIGIGTSNPSEKLDVVGNVKATLFNINGNGTLSQNGFWGTLNTKGTGSYSDWTLIDSVGNGIMWNPSGTLNMAFSGNVGVGTNSPTTLSGYNTLTIDGPSGSFTEYRQNGTALFRIGADGSRPFLYGMTNAPMDFFTNGSERMRITAAGSTLFNTTTDPTTGGFTNTTVLIKQKADGTFGGGLQIEENATTAVAYFGFSGSVFNIGTSYRSTGDYRPITFSTEGLERLRIANNGNIGIGTTNPYAKLTVNGTTSITDGSSSITFGQWDGSTNRIEFANRPLRFAGYWGNSDIIFANNSDQERMRIVTTGQVGIGTSLPSSKLDVTDWTTYISVSSAANSESTTDGQPLAGINFRKHYAIGIGASIKQLQAGGPSSYSQAHLAFYTNDASVGWNDPVERMRITSGGNVGIGTQNPQNYSGLVSLTIGDNSGSKIGLLKLRSNYNGGDGAEFWQDGNGLLRINTNSGTIAMGITAGGDIGIGTTNPNYKVDVNGFIGATRLYPANSNNTYITGDGNAGMAVVGSGYFYVTAAGGSYFQNEVRFRNRIENDINPFLQINGGTTGVTYFAGTIGVGGSNVYHNSSIQVGNGIFYAQSNASDIGGKIYGFWDTGFQPYAGGLKFQVFRVETGSYQMYDAMTLSGSGKVGIGTTSPNNKLTVNGGISGTPTWNNSTLELESNGGLTTSLAFHRAGYSVSCIYSDDGSLAFQVGGGEKIRITPYNTGIGTSSPNSSAVLDVASTTQGFLPPRMNDAEMNSISSPAAGLMVWNIDAASIFVFDGGSWRKIAYA